LPYATVVGCLFTKKTSHFLYNKDLFFKYQLFFNKLFILDFLDFLKFLKFWIFGILEILDFGKIKNFLKKNSLNNN
jgi:hypothetical protein